MITQKKLDRRKRRKASSRGDGSGRKQSAGSSVPQEPDPPSSHSSVRKGQASPRNNNNDSRGERTPRTEYASPAANGSNDGGERNVETPVLTPHPVHYLAQQRRLQEQQSWTPRDITSRDGNTGQDGVGSRGSSSIGHTAHLTPVSGRVIVAPLAQSMNLFDAESC